MICDKQTMNVHTICTYAFDGLKRRIKINGLSIWWLDIKIGNHLVA
jgi:hypothetical protein